MNDHHLSDRDIKYSSNNREAGHAHSVCPDSGVMTVPGRAALRLACIFLIRPGYMPYPFVSTKFSYTLEPAPTGQAHASALDNIDGQSAARCFLIFRLHIRPGLHHGPDYFVQ